MLVSTLGCLRRSRQSKGLRFHEVNTGTQPSRRHDHSGVLTSRMGKAKTRTVVPVFTSASEEGIPQGRPYGAGLLY
jgi:hypothetical protein